MRKGNIAEKIENTDSAIVRQRHTIKKSTIFFVVSVLFVAALAGVRDYTIGTDIKSYGNDLFNYAHGNISLSSFIERLPHIEPLYLTLVYFSAKISSSPHMLYFLTGVIIYGFMMAGMVKHSKSIPVTISWFAFLCLLYGDTYNAMRQTLAIAIGFWAFHFAEEGKWKRFLVGVLISFFFHNTAIIFIGIYIMYFVLQKNNKLYIKAILLFGVFAAISCFNQLLTFFMDVGIFDMKMTRYFIDESSGFSINAILIRLPFLFLILLEYKQFWKNERGAFTSLKNEAEGDFYILTLILELLTVLMSAFLPSLYRIALYFVPFRCMAYSRVCMLETSKQTRIIKTFVLVLYLLIIFIYQNQIKGNNEIYPYVFGTL